MGIVLVHMKHGHLPKSLSTSNGRVSSIKLFQEKCVCKVFLLSTITETDEIRTDNSSAGVEVKSHDSHIGNSGLVATGSMRKTIVLSNGASNAAHDMNSAIGKN